ncbi:MAG: guanylate kinase [Gemmatimonadota bacterium]
MSGSEPTGGPWFPLVLAGPSGSGKTTVARELAGRRRDLLFSVSATTRRPRAHETDGRDYRFVDRDGFESLVSQRALLEWAEVHGELYGTPRANLVEAEEAGAHLLLDIDVQGARQLREGGLDAVAVFLLPPSGRQGLERLRRRGTEGGEELARRLQTAGTELEAIGLFDYVVVNDDLERTVATVEAILAAEACRVARVADLSGRVKEITEEIDRSLPCARETEE